MLSAADKGDKSQEEQIKQDEALARKLGEQEDAAMARQLADEDRAGNPRQLLPAAWALFPQNQLMASLTHQGHLGTKTYLAKTMVSLVAVSTAHRPRCHLVRMADCCPAV